MSLKSKLGKLGRVLGNLDLYRHFFYNLIQVRKLGKPPVIICGCPRSGTTLLMSILDSHPEIHVIPFETAVLQARTIDSFFKNGLVNNLFSRTQIIAYLFSGKIKPTANRWCEKTPLNILNVEKINHIYSGNVLFLNIVRDGRAVVASQHARYGYMVKPELWYNCILAGRKLQSMLNFYTVRYEDIVLYPKQTMGEIKEFLKLKDNFSERWFEHTNIKGKITSMVNGLSEGSAITRPINPASLKSWNKSESPWLPVFVNNLTYMELNHNIGYHE